MATYIKTMKDINGDTVLPRTCDKAVTVGDGSSNLETALLNRPEKPSLLPDKTTLADTDLVTIEGTGGVVNKMTVGNFRNLLLDAQENWNSAILENGWTGYVEYKRDLLGNITIRGKVTGGVKDGFTLVAVIPMSYAPKQSIPIPLYSIRYSTPCVDSAFFYIDFYGNIRIPQTQPHAIEDGDLSFEITISK